MRKAINGLVAIVEGEMELDPFNAALFVFCNRLTKSGRCWVRLRLMPTWLSK